MFIERRERRILTSCIAIVEEVARCCLWLREHLASLGVTARNILYVQSDVRPRVCSVERAHYNKIISAISNLAPSIWPVAITTKWLGPLDMANGCRSPRAQFAA